MPRTRGTPHRLLIVDDDPQIVRILVTLANERGYAAVGAMDLDEVLRQMEVTRPDVVLLDLNMPRNDGRELLAKLTETPDAPAVIIMSGWVDALTYEVCRRYGATDVIAKPFRVDDLFRRVDAVARMVPAR